MASRDRRHSLLARHALSCLAAPALSQRDLAWFCIARGKLSLFGGPRLLALEELGGTDDCVWSGRVLDEALLRKFGAEITAVEQALGSDNREGDVMLDAGGRFRRREVLAGRLEEIHCSLICE